MSIYDRTIATLADWGLYWVRTAAEYAGTADACHHNANMNAMQIMAIEAVS